VVRCSISAKIITALSKEVAQQLTSEFKNRFVATHNSNVIYPLEKLNELRVDCWPQSLQRDRTSRAGFSTIATVSVAIQQRANDQEKMDLLTDLSEELLDWFVHSGRWANGRLLCSDGAFSGTDLFNRTAKYEENVFVAILQINFKQFT
jgi:hypothetical protein